MGSAKEKNTAYAKIEYVKKSPNDRQKKKKDSEYRVAQRLIFT